MTNNDGEIPQVDGPNLYSVSAKLFAIGELIKFRGGEPSLEEEQVNYGLGELLTDLAKAITASLKS